MPAQQLAERFRKELIFFFKEKVIFLFLICTLILLLSVYSLIYKDYSSCITILIYIYNYQDTKLVFSNFQTCIIYENWYIYIERKAGCPSHVEYKDDVHWTKKEAEEK
jgi:hypothetical protein